jgi:hypothetical protein
MSDFCVKTKSQREGGNSHGRRPEAARHDGRRRRRERGRASVARGVERTGSWQTGELECFGKRIYTDGKIYIVLKKYQ